MADQDQLRAELRAGTDFENMSFLDRNFLGPQMREIELGELKAVRHISVDPREIALEQIFRRFVVHDARSYRYRFRSRRIK
jgi:hypothetical protein